MRAAAAATLLLLATAAARAHDTWLSWHEGPAKAAPLVLSTGHAWPQRALTVPRANLAEAACRTPDGRRHTLAVRRQAADGLWLDAARLPRQGALSCWARTRPLEITLSPALVATYLDEVNAPPAVRAAWAAQQAAGLPWRERYSKHARLERLEPVPAGAGQPVAAATRPAADRRTGAAQTPAGMALELVLLGPAPQVGQMLTLQAWRQGQPAAGLALQLLNDSAPTGLWVRTDAQGQVRLRLPLPGPWLVRGTELTPPAQPGGHWQGHFVTLAFEPLGAQPPLRSPAPG